MMKERWLISLLFLLFFLFFVASTLASERSTARSLVVNNKLELEAEAAPDPSAGIYVGFGEAATGGNVFSLQAAFPRFVNGNAQTVPVNIYIMAQLPNGYLYFLRPGGHFEPGIRAWRMGVTQPLQETIIPPFPLVNPLTGENILEPGTYTFSTLVIEAVREEDLSDLNWDYDSMELTFYEVDILPFWLKQ